MNTVSAITSRAFIRPYLLQKDEAKNSILIPFMKLFCDLTYDDIFKAGNRNRRIVLIFYILFFLLMVTLYFSLWRPIENWLDRDVS